MRRPFTRLYCHLVWATWDRLPLITPEIEPRLHAAIRTKIEELRGVPIAVNGMPDHVHVLCSFNPIIAIAYLVQQLKGSSSHLATSQLLNGDEFRWQGAYGAFTVSATALNRARDYIVNQKRHHSEQSLSPEWEQTGEIPDAITTAKTLR